jgi:hypothetical protein
VEQFRDAENSAIRGESSREFTSMMRMKGSGHRVLAAFAVAVSAFAGFGAARPALAFDDQSTITSVLGLVGVPIEQNDEKIDYRERPKLVLPPSREALPQPQARGDGRPGDWPLDQDVVRRRQAAAAAREPAPQPGLNQNPVISPRELAKDRGEAGPRTAGDSECLNSSRRECLLMSPEEAKAGTSEKRFSVTAGDEPNRSYLTEPPRGYRRATKDVKATSDAPKEKEDWSNPLAYIRQQAGKVVGGGD